MTKITIVGAGNVGSQAAFYAALKCLGDIVLIDIAEGLAEGKALDLAEAMPIAGSDVKIKGSNDYSASQGSEVVVITAGIPRKPGMSRDDLVKVNSSIMKSIIPEIVRYSPDCILIIVTNPLDVMAQLAYELSGFPKERVIGMAGVLDTARFRTFAAWETKASVKEVEAMVLGSHGDLMVPLVNYCKVRGEKIANLLPEEKIKEIIQRVKDGGTEVVKLLKTGSAFFAPGLAIMEMVESILKDKKKVLPCSVLLEGEYGVEGIFIGVPVRLGKEGVEEIVEAELNGEERIALEKSVEHMKEMISQ